MRIGLPGERLLARSIGARGTWPELVQTFFDYRDHRRSSANRRGRRAPNRVSGARQSCSSSPWAGVMQARLLILR